MTIMISIILISWQSHGSHTTFPSQYDCTSTLKELHFQHLYLVPMKKVLLMLPELSPEYFLGRTETISLKLEINSLLSFTKQIYLGCKTSCESLQRIPSTALYGRIQRIMDLSKFNGREFVKHKKQKVITKN